MAPSSRSACWERVRTVEDALAILDRIETSRRIIRLQIWHEGDLETAYAEATAMKGDLARLKALLSARWAELFESARGQNAQADL